MPNLVGTGLNQVPTNGMLGGLAYQDPDHASIKDLDLKNLSQINSQISVANPCSAFVYDTSKDSDGGAWRLRCQEKSWYKETLGTLIRGTRREFPSVAVIIYDSTSKEVTIYDADDPNMPMWMVIPGTTTDWANNNGNATDVEMLNGVLVASYTGSGAAILDFVEDKRKIAYSSSYHFRQSAIEYRDNGAYLSGEGYDLSSNQVNDVSMSIHPKAEVNPATGLERPTIALSTNTGLNVITHKNVVAQRNHGYGGSMKASADGQLIAVAHNGRTGGQNIEIINSDYLDQIGDGASAPVHADNSVSAGENDYGYGTNNGTDFQPFTLLNWGNNIEPVLHGNDIWIGQNIAYHIHENRYNTANTMVNRIGISYNSGWMHGNCSQAHLGSTGTDCTSDFTSNGRGLTKVGTINNAPVRTGAELQGFSGFSGSNHLTRANSTFNYGNPGKICLMGWQRLTNVSDYSYMGVAVTSSAVRCGLSINRTGTNNPGTVYWYTDEALQSNYRVDDGYWHFTVGILDNQLSQIYIDGELVAQNTSATARDLSSTVYHAVGHYTPNLNPDRAYHHSGDLALVRFSNSSPTAEEIKKIYDQEKHMFEEYAAVTMSGNSSTITGRDYDSKTGIYSYGSSAARSDFKGLCRINNTTLATPSGCLSAHDGLIVG